MIDDKIIYAKMEIINNENKLNLCWIDWNYNGKIYLPPLGPRGGTGYEQEFGCPTTIQWIIKIKNIEDIQLLFEIFEKLSLENDINVVYNEPKLQKIRGLLKSEYKQQYYNFPELIRQRNIKIKKLEEKLQALGCQCDIDYPSDLVPDEWYEWYDYYDYTQACVNVCCHSDTKTYQSLKSLLIKYKPNWY